MAGWPWPLDGLQHWFEDLWNWISTAAVNAVRVVSGWIWNAVNWLKDRLVEVGSWVWSQIKPLLGPVADWVEKAAVLVAYAFVEFAKDPIGFIKRGVNWIGDMLTNAWNSLAAGVNAVGSWLGGALDAAKNAILGGLTAVGKGLTDVYNGVVGVVSEVGNRLSTAFNGAVATIGGWVSDALAGVAKALGDALRGVWDWFATNIPAAAAAVGTFLTERVAKPIMGALSWVVNGISDMLRGFYQSIIDFFKARSPVTPEEAASYTVPLMLISGTAGLGAAVVGAVGSLKVLGSGVEARALTDFIRDLFGLADMFKLTLGPLLTAAYGEPIRLYYNAVYRPAIPSTGQADQMLFEGHISEDEWRRIYAYHGWKDADMEAWRKTMYREPSQRTLLTMLEDPEVGEPWVRKKLAELGFNAEDIDVMIAYKRRLIEAKAAKALESEKAKLRDNAKADYVKGYIVENDLRSTLQTLGYSPEEVEYYVEDAKQDLERKQKDMLVDYYVDAYVKDIIKTADELAANLSTVIVDPEVVELTVGDAYVRKYKKPPPEKPVTVDKALEQVQELRRELAVLEYRKYVIEKDELIREFVETGLSAEAAALKADIEELKRPVQKPTAEELERLQQQRRLRKVNENTLVEAYRKGQISSGELTVSLMDLGMSEALAKAVTQLEMLRVLPKPKGGVGG